MMLSFLFHHDWSMWDVLIILLILSLFFWKKILLLALNAILTIFMLPLAVISALFGWEPKFIKRWEENVEKYKREHKQK